MLKFGESGAPRRSDALDERSNGLFDRGVEIYRNIRNLRDPLALTMAGSVNLMEEISRGALSRCEKPAPSR
jgi:hypothetical protein